MIPVILSPIIGRFAHKLDMRRLVTFSFIMYAVCFYWRAGPSNRDGLWRLGVATVYPGFAVACFFMPLTTITLSACRRSGWRRRRAVELHPYPCRLHRDSITTTLWTNREALHHAQLTESVTPLTPTRSRYTISCRAWE